ncbi:MAG: NAD(P)-dependent oxidoreductase [Alphaproteobacteria bacterium]|nr:NAD(P)-dependent oxidoreductase [Alphaproteobacteria bacterium]
MIYVIGGRGLVGSAVVRRLTALGRAFRVIGREDAQSVMGTSCDVLFYCNGNAMKGKANANPWFDFEASVASAARYVMGIEAGLVAHVSSIDVYSDPTTRRGTDETAAIDRARLMPYGFNKLMAEDIVRRYARSHLVFRLAGLVGPGLAKNPVYDWVTPGKKVMISPDSVLNFMHTDIIAETMLALIDAGVRDDTFNVASRDSVRIGDLERITGASTDYTDDARSHTQTYHIAVDKVSARFPMPSSEECIRRHVAGQPTKLGDMSGSG